MTSGVTYQVESGPAFISGASHLWQAHFDEAHPNWPHKWNPNITAYLSSEMSGELLILTARRAGRIIGYAMFIVKLHPHYQKLVAFDDDFYVVPEERKGLVGYKLLKTGIELLKKRGCVEWSLTSPAGKDYSLLFKRLGMSPAYSIWRGRA
jgi:GNAT superfamily N-acetyltransferase